MPPRSSSFCLLLVILVPYVLYQRDGSTTLWERGGGPWSRHFTFSYYIMITALAMSRFLGITLVIGVVGRPKKMTAGTGDTGRCAHARAYNGGRGREREVE